MDRSAGSKYAMCRGYVLRSSTLLRDFFSMISIIYSFWCFLSLLSLSLFIWDRLSFVWSHLGTSFTSSCCWMAPWWWWWPGSSADGDPKWWPWWCFASFIYSRAILTAFLCYATLLIASTSFLTPYISFFYWSSKSFSHPLSTFCSCFMVLILIHIALLYPRS